MLTRRDTTFAYHAFLLAALMVLTAPLDCNAFVATKSYAPIHTQNHIAIPSRAPSRILNQQKRHPSQLRMPRSTEACRLQLAWQEPVMQYLTSTFSATGGVPLVQAFSINALGFLLLQKPLSKILTVPGILNAFLLGGTLWTMMGWKGWSVCVAFLVTGSLVTKVRFKEKEKLGIAESRGGKRGPENLWGSAATGLACAVCSVQGPTFLGISSDLFVLAYVASLATKIADTFASEIGKAYGKTTFLITTFQRVEPGTEGAVSAEGTAAAALGGFILSAYGYSLGLIATPTGVIISTMAAFLATNVESLIGATLQEKDGMEWMTNEVVNFLNTLIGAGLAIAGGKLLL